MARWQPNDIFIPPISYKIGLVFDSHSEVVLAEHVRFWNANVFVNKFREAVEIPFAVRLHNVRPHFLDLLGSEIAVEDWLRFGKQVYQAILFFTVRAT